jgi:hypothetical protein
MFRVPWPCTRGHADVVYQPVLLVLQHAHEYMGMAPADDEFKGTIGRRAVLSETRWNENRQIGLHCGL